MAVFLGTISGKIFQRIKIPQVVGYIILGVIIGKSFLHLFEGDAIKSLTPLVNFTLGIIGCVIGSELKTDVFKKFGKSIYTILIAEGVLAFFAVAAVVTLITKKLYLGLILGAIASATDPASTVNVLWEYKAKGPVTRTLTSIVALDDALALIIYGLVSVFSKAMIAKQSFSLVQGLAVPLLEIFECFAIGVVFGLIVVKIIAYIKEESLVLSFMLGAIACCVGISNFFHLDLILSSMTLGITIANTIPKISEKLFNLIKDMTTPLYILFFVVIGAQLDIQIFLNISILAIVLAYLVARSLGKIYGAMLGGIIAKAKKQVTRYTGLGLFTQGGVAMGLALSISNNLNSLEGGQQIGILIINVVAATTFVVQLIGPSLVKYVITKTDEINRNVTKEDIIESLKISDIMCDDFIAISEETSLNEIIKIIKTKDSFNFPVINKAGVFSGVISIKELKDALLEEDLNNFILAKDIASVDGFTLLAQDSLTKAFDIFDKRALDFLPVINNEEKRAVIGIIEHAHIKEQVDLRLLERHNNID